MRTIDQMVSMEVCYCVSSLVSTVAEGYGQLNSSTAALCDLTEQAFELASPIPDYEEAAREAGWTKGLKGAPATFLNDEANDTSCSETWEELCEENDIDPYDREVYEHWIVTDWLADKLEAEGEKIDRDFAGLTVWARTTTGQGISSDGVIERIYAETHKAE